MSKLEQRDLFRPGETTPARLPEATRRAARAELRRLLKEAIMKPTEPDEGEAANYDDR